MLTTSTRNAEPRNSEGVSKTVRPMGVLALSGPPSDPSQPSHSASCPTTYTRLNTVASTADQNPTTLVDCEMGVSTFSYRRIVVVVIITIIKLNLTPFLYLGPTPLPIAQDYPNLYTLISLSLTRQITVLKFKSNMILWFRAFLLWPQISYTLFRKLRCFKYLNGLSFHNLDFVVFGWRNQNPICDLFILYQICHLDVTFSFRDPGIYFVVHL